MPNKKQRSEYVILDSLQTCDEANLQNSHLMCKLWSCSLKTTAFPQSFPSFLCAWSICPLFPRLFLCLCSSFLSLSVKLSLALSRFLSASNTKRGDQWHRKLLANSFWNSVTTFSFEFTLTPMNFYFETRKSISNNFLHLVR